MTELAAELAALSRPSVLVRAARFGAAASLRNPPKPRARNRKPWPKLLQEEAGLDAALSKPLRKEVLMNRIAALCPHDAASPLPDAASRA